MDKVYVATSSISGAGNGLFASEFIKKDDIIIEYTGKILNFSESRRLKNRAYLKVVDFNKHIDASVDNASNAKFINDNLDKTKINVTFVKIKVVGDSRIFVKALRDVQIDEELFVSYGRGHWLFQTSLDFLDLKVEDSTLVTTTTFNEAELVSVFATSLVHGVLHPIGRFIALAQTSHLANCVLRKNPMIPDTIMIETKREIPPKCKLSICVDEYDTYVAQLLKTLNITSPW